MFFLGWLTAPGYHWLILIIVFLAACWGIALIVREFRAEGGDSHDEPE